MTRQPQGRSAWSGWRNRAMELEAELSAIRRLVEVLEMLNARDSWNQDDGVLHEETVRALIAKLLDGPGYDHRSVTPTDDKKPERPADGCVMWFCDICGCFDPCPHPVKCKEPTPSE